MISSLNAPFSIAAPALFWLFTAKASCSSRESEYFLATFSAVSPIPRYAALFFISAGFGIGLKPVMGTRLMPSIPAAMKTSPAPMAIWPAA